MATVQSQDALDAHTLLERLQWEQRDYWMHLEAESPLEKYPAKQHARRVQEKLGAEAGLIYLPGASNRNIEDSDMPMKFRQRRYFYYLTGCNEPDCFLVYNIRKDALTLFLPKYDPRRVLYYGRGSTKAEAMARYDIDEARYADELEAYVADWASDPQGRIYILHPTQAPPVSKYPVAVDSKSLQPAMNLARVVKDHHEIKMIRKANDISSLAHKEVLAHVRRFKNEAQVEGLFLDVCISKQAKEQAYDPIAASGPNAGTLHYAANNEDFGDRQLMCLDAGCEYELYASDITRTFPLSGSWPSTEAEEIYRLVERMQESCIARLAPGLRYLDLHILAHQIAIDGLLKLGILHNGTREEIFKAGTSKAFFPHGLGHHVGLEVHDVGQADLMSMIKGNPTYEKAPSLYPENFHLPVYDVTACMAPTDPQSGHLEEGMVVTVEPGIYFSTYLLDHFYYPSPIHSKYINKAVVEKYLPVGGVRIEDDILITSKGHENLTTAPKGEAMLDIIRGGNAQWLPDLDDADLELLRQKQKFNTTVGEEKMVKAPGIARDSPNPIHVSLKRVQSLPVKKNGSKAHDPSRQVHLWLDRVENPLVEKKASEAYDFEPFDGPSLYADFKNASTIDHAAVRESSKKTYRSRPHARKPRVPVCGEDFPEAEHTYLDMPGEGTASSHCPIREKKPICKSCFVLVQTLGRLRQNLSMSEHGSAKSTFDRFGTKRTGVEPLKSASQTGPIDASTRCHPQKGALPDLCNLTASPLQIEAHELETKMHAEAARPSSLASQVVNHLQHLDIAAGDPDNSGQILPGKAYVKTMRETGTKPSQYRLRNWLSSTSNPPAQSPNSISHLGHDTRYSMPHPPKPRAVSLISAMTLEKTGKPSNSSPPLVSSNTSNNPVLPQNTHTASAIYHPGTPELPQNTSRSDAFRLPSMQQVHHTHFEQSHFQASRPAFSPPPKPLQPTTAARIESLRKLIEYQQDLLLLERQQLILDNANLQ